MHRRRADRLRERPLISVIVPTYETPEAVLRECLDSVLAQSYPHWELCIADDASSSPHVRRVLAEYRARDPRIEVTFRERNGHISEASNTALAMAKGEFVALARSRRRAGPARAFGDGGGARRRARSTSPTATRTSSTIEGRRFEPFFKPDWNEELFLCNNYLCHLTLVRRSIVEKIGGFRTGFDGAQDYDLLLRATRCTDPDRIRHMPKVLYHWRAIAGSTARSHRAKGYAAKAGLAALRDHMLQVEPRAVVEPGPHPTTYRVRWPVPDPGAAGLDPHTNARSGRSAARLRRKHRGQDDLSVVRDRHRRQPKPISRRRWRSSRRRPGIRASGFSLTTDRSIFRPSTISPPAEARGGILRLRQQRHRGDRAGVAA